MTTEIYLRGDIVWATNKNAVGNVQSSTRPYLIISNNQCNRHSPTITVIPLTSKTKHYLPTHYIIKINDKQNIVLVKQITCINKAEICGYMGTVEDSDLVEIERKIKIQLGIKE